MDKKYKNCLYFSLFVKAFEHQLSLCQIYIIGLNSTWSQNAIHAIQIMFYFVMIYFQNIFNCYLVASSQFFKLFLTHFNRYISKQRLKYSKNRSLKTKTYIILSVQYSYSVYNLRKWNESDKEIIGFQKALQKG